MNIPSLTNSPHPIQLAASALAAGLALLAVPAFAQQYVAHPGLTPYQIIREKDNMCLAASLAATPADAQMAPCNATSNAQKFYVLHPDSVTDFVPQTDGSRDVVQDNARIVLASEFDKDPGARMLFLANINGTGYFVPADYPGKAHFNWTLQRPQWKWITWEGSSFSLGPPPPSVTRLKYGRADHWLYKDGQPHETVQCTNTYMGGDPYYGSVKNCYQWIGSADNTPMQVTVQPCLANLPALPTCLAPDAVLTLRPTTYPQ